jgi:hypothetical protein
VAEREEGGQRRLVGSLVVDRKSRHRIETRGKTGVTLHDRLGLQAFPKLVNNLLSIIGC